MPHQHSGQQRSITHHNGGKRHARNGTRPPIFEERIRRPSGADGAESTAGEEPKRSPRNGAQEDGLYYSWNMTEVDVLACFGSCESNTLFEGRRQDARDGTGRKI